MRIQAKMLIITLILSLLGSFAMRPQRAASIKAKKNIKIAAAQTEIPDEIYLTRRHQQEVRSQRDEAEIGENLSPDPVPGLFEQGLFNLHRVDAKRDQSVFKLLPLCSEHNLIAFADTQTMTSCSATRRTSPRPEAAAEETAQVCAHPQPLSRFHSVWRWHRLCRRRRRQTRAK